MRNLGNCKCAAQKSEPIIRRIRNEAKGLPDSDNFQRPKDYCKNLNIV